MSTSALSGLRRGLLLWALVLGVVGMHQLVTADGMDVMPATVMSSSMSMEPNVTQADHDGAPGEVPHDLMHLCLAVLCAFGVAVLLAMTRRLVATPLPSSRSDARAQDRPPPIGGRLLLASVCVLRL